MVAVAALTVGFWASQRPANAIVTVQGLELPQYAADEDVVTHTGYTASYNHQTLCPNWVAWELTSEEVDGDLGGSYSFSRDPDVEEPKASREDYKNSGYDKGHMAPRADMKWSETALRESYYFTNICPQNHQMNSQGWRKIEELSRRLATHYGRLYIVCGPIYQEHRLGTIGSQGLQVPDRFFKALAVTTDDGYRTVAFIMENSPQNKSPHHYAVSVDSVERILGRNLFPKVDELAERDYDWNDWNIK